MVNETLIIGGLIFLFVLVYIGILATVGVFRRNKTLQVGSGEQPAHMEVTPKPRPPKPPVSLEPSTKTSSRETIPPWDDALLDTKKNYVLFFGEAPNPLLFLTVLVLPSDNGSEYNFSKTTVEDMKRLPRYKHPDLFDFIVGCIKRDRTRSLNSVTSSLMRVEGDDGRLAFKFLSDIILIAHQFYDSVPVEYGPEFDGEKVRQYIKAYDFDEAIRKLNAPYEYWFLGTILRYFVYVNILSRNVYELEKAEAARKKGILAKTDIGRARAIKNRYRDPRVRLQQPPVLIEGKRK